MVLDRARCGESLAVAVAFDDDLVAGVGEAVEGAVAEDGILEKAEPSLHRPVASALNAPCRSWSNGSRTVWPVVSHLD